jgi:hypothetical protein
MMMKNKLHDLLASLEFWYAKRFIKLDKHYTFFLDLNGTSNSFAVKYLKKYNGVIIEFNNVKVGDNGQMTFDYDIVSNVNNCDVKTKGFERFTQNVMRSILYGAIQNDVRDKNESRNTDSIEFDSERSVHEKGTSVSEKRISDRKPRKKTVRRNKKFHSKIQ